MAPRRRPAGSPARGYQKNSKKNLDPPEGSQQAKKEYLWEGLKLQKRISFESPIQATNDLNKNLNKGK